MTPTELAAWKEQFVEEPEPLTLSDKVSLTLTVSRTLTLTWPPGRCGYQSSASPARGVTW